LTASAPDGAHKAVVAFLHGGGGAVIPSLNPVEALHIPLLGKFPVAGEAFQLGLVPAQHAVFLPPVLPEKMVLRLPVLGVHKGGGAGSEILGHDKRVSRFSGLQRWVWEQAL
jgi:hypothetical protein